MSRGAPNAANAIRELFEHCHDTLSIECLEWLGNLDNAAEQEATNIAATLDGLAGLLAKDDNPARPDDSELALMLWGLASCARTVAVLVDVSGEAAHLASKKKSEGEAVKAMQGGEQ